MTASRAEAEYRLTDPELGQLVVERVLPTGVTLGAGAYGSVEEVEIPGARVAAKKLHSQLINLGSSEKVPAHRLDSSANFILIMHSMLYGKLI